jgi:hypothetical protein
MMDSRRKTYTVMAHSGLTNPDSRVNPALVVFVSERIGTGPDLPPL